MRCTFPLADVSADGTLVEIRPIRPDDRELLERGFARLSHESRYRRFLAPRSQLTPAELSYLTQVDGKNHVAVGAVIRQGSLEEGLGIARFVRVEADIAEVAIAVIDEYQGRGIGRRLFQCLTAAALDQGVRTFRCDVLASNTAMLRLLERVGTVTTAVTGGTMTAEVELIGPR